MTLNSNIDPQLENIMNKNDMNKYPPKEDPVQSSAWAEKTCPHCGRCPTCGRSYWPQPYNPAPYWANPYWYGPGTITCGGQTNA